MYTKCSMMYTKWNLEDCIKSVQTNSDRVELICSGIELMLNIGFACRMSITINQSVD